MVERWKILDGDARVELARIEDDSVDCVVTSPPYWSLRDYGVDGQIGLEASPTEYIQALVSVFAEVRRVLRASGTLWLNLGDTYVAGRNGGIGASSVTSQRNQIAARAAWVAAGGATHRKVDGLKPKDLIGIPWRVALALQADGWWLRSDIVWSKPSPMPESVRDRPTKAHEYLFLLAKAERYFYDAAAISEPVTGPKAARNRRGVKQNASFSAAVSGLVETRNARSVWTIAQTPESEDHTATFPAELARRCILAGCPAEGLVLDPFAGLGTAGSVALSLGRRFVGIELNPKYAATARDRCVEALEGRGEATVEDAEHKRGPTQLGLLANGNG